MRVVTKANVTITDGSENKDCLFGPNDGTAESSLDGLQESTSSREKLTASDVFVIPFAQVDSPKGFFIRSTGDFNLVINGHTGAQFQIRRGITATGGAKAAYVRCLMEMDLTSLQVTAVEDCELLWAVWGNPVA